MMEELGFSPERTFKRLVAIILHWSESLISTEESSGVALMASVELLNPTIGTGGKPERSSAFCAAIARISSAASTASKES